MRAIRAGHSAPSPICNSTFVWGEETGAGKATSVSTVDGGDKARPGELGELLLRITIALETSGAGTEATTRELFQSNNFCGSNPKVGIECRMNSGRT